MEEASQTQIEEKTEWGFDQILQQFIDKIDKTSIKNGLEDKIIINKITSDGVFFIAISKVAQLIFSNQDNVRYIEDKMSEVLGKQTAVHLSFENKENYFARKLENI